MNTTHPKTNANAEPNPRPCFGLPVMDGSDQAEPRHRDCRSYDRCLDIAEEWPAFTCGSCEAYEPLTRTERKRDLPGLAAAFGHCVRDISPRLGLLADEIAAKVAADSREALPAIACKRAA